MSKSRAWVPLLGAGVLAGGMWLFREPLSRGVAAGSGVIILNGQDIWILSVFTAAVLVLLMALSVYLSSRLGSRGAKEGLLGVPRTEVGRGSAGLWQLGGWLLVIYGVGWLVLG